jgi:hypothetical protein
MYKPTHYNGSEFGDSLLELELICDKMTHKYVFDNEKLKIVFDNEVIPPIYNGLNYELHPKQYGESTSYLSARQINTDDMSNKVCLTANSNMDKQYVLK